jgi:putative tryptophan/tyrosine transport system substrate-binding protein
MPSPELGASMRRREFVGLLGGAAVWPLATKAQPRLPVIGVLGLGPSPNFVELRNGLAEGGLVEGRDYTFEYRSAQSAQYQQDQIAAQIADLLQSGVALITTGSLPQALAAKASTTTVPIIFQTGADPVAAGLVGSLNSPGGNLTGVSILNTAVIGKRLQILHELASTATSFAHFVNPTNKFYADAETGELQAAARALGARLMVLNITNAAEIDDAFATLDREGVDGVVVGGDAVFVNNQHELISLAARHKMPSIYQSRDFVAIGGLASYGTRYSDGNRICGVYAARILKGEKPADLPVQQITKTELAINLKTAKALNLTVLPTLLIRADEVIE